jgi:hypothetical protein
MYRIIKPRGSGKTEEILHLAEENNAIVVCSNPHIYKKMAAIRGWNDDIIFVSYKDYLNKQYDYNDRTPIVIDEIDGLLNCLKGDIIGYSLSP